MQIRLPVIWNAVLYCDLAHGSSPRRGSPTSKGRVQARWTIVAMEVQEEEDLEPFLKDEDPIPLRYPSQSKRRLRANETAAAGSTGSATWKTRLALLTVAGLAVLLLIAGSFVGGIYLGKKIAHDQASSGSDMLFQAVTADQIKAWK